MEKGQHTHTQTASLFIHLTFLKLIFPACLAAALLVLFFEFCLCSFHSLLLPMPTGVLDEITPKFGDANEMTAKL